eukprot:5548309-Alexandrium_andersonii.AAC.1
MMHPRWRSRMALTLIARSRAAYYNTIGSGLITCYQSHSGASLGHGVASGSPAGWHLRQGRDGR